MPTYGPNTTGTGVDLGAVWVSPGNITVNDSSYATWSSQDGGGGGCFLSGTLISCPENDKYIEDICVGDIVFDVDYNLVSVVALHVNIVNEYIEFTTSNGITKVTKDHPFLFNGSYIQADTINIGDIVSDFVILNKVYYDSKVKVYNMSVDGSNTFIANKFKVHNK